VCRNCWKVKASLTSAYPTIGTEGGEYGVQIIRGLAAAHDRCIFHRDLEPENVFVTRDGHVKILNFGGVYARVPKGMRG